MQRILYILLTFLIFGLIFSCAYNDQTKNLDSWLGEYNYTEEPVKANESYFMVMDWTLSVNEKNETYQGILEVNGQQTYLKILADIAGNRNTIAVIYNGIIDGIEENLRKGDTLFVLSKKTNGLHTKWFELEPRLLETSQKECNCFTQTKNRSR